MAKPTKHELHIRDLGNEAIDNCYIASSSCHGSNGLPKHEFRGLREFAATQLPHLRRDLTNNVCLQLLHRKITWRLWICVYYNDAERDMLGFDIEEATLTSSTCNDVNAHISKRVRDMIIENVEAAELNVLDITGFGWCAFPNDSYDIESLEGDLHKYFISCGVDDVSKSNIVLVKEGAAAE